MATSEPITTHPPKRPKALDFDENKIRTSLAAVKVEAMARAEWTRWGRGMCEGYALEIGTAFRGAVVRSDTHGLPSMWIASVNTTALGEYLERGEAMRRVEEVIEGGMGLVLHDWELYRAAKGKPTK